VTGFRAALTAPQTTGAQGGRAQELRDGNLSGDTSARALTAVISVKLTDPQFEGQTKAKLGQRRVSKGLSKQPLTTALTQYLEENPRGQSYDKVPHRRPVTLGR